jgi:O-antigen ligase
VGIALVFLLLLASRQTKRMSQLFSVLAWSFAALVLAIVVLSAVGWKVQGRLGPMDLSSLTKEVQSIWPSSAASAELGHESDRRAWYGEVWNHVRSSPSGVLLGVGFGGPLVDFISDTGQPVRQPHNSSLNVFGRLGLLGLSIWLLFLAMLLKRLWIAAHAETRIAGVFCPVHLWFFAFAVLGLLDSMVQPYFEFSHSAVPFFFLMGVALGIRPEASSEPAAANPSGERHWMTTPGEALRALPW